MSEVPSTTRCPKCGYNSRDDSVCDACGAIFSKVRQREVEQEIMGLQDNERPARPPGTISGLGFLVKAGVILIAMAAAGATYWYQVAQYNFPTPSRLISWHRQIVTDTRKDLASDRSAKDKTQSLEKRMAMIRKLAPMIGTLPAPRDSLDSIRLAAIQGANELATAELAVLTDAFTAGETPAKGNGQLAVTSWLLDVAENPYEDMIGAAEVQAAARKISPAAAENLRQTVVLIEDRRNQFRQETADSVAKVANEEDASKQAKLPAK